MLLDIIAGARPNFMKIAPIIKTINSSNSINKKISFRLIHTGQHYDKNMSESFLKQLEIPNPDYNLASGSGTQSEQTAKIMIGYEKLLQINKPDICLVVGDVNSTMACAIVAKKMHVKVAHVEAGIRSGDVSMPEEINRMVTDSITDFFFTTSETANNNLILSGVNPKFIFFVGNTMIDTLVSNMPRFIKPPVWSKYNLNEKSYIVVTLHRPSNVDDQSILNELIESIVSNSRGIPIIFPAHPRTIKQLSHVKLNYSNLIIINPLSYLEFNFLVKNSKAVVTDSGGITEETTFMGIPCMTMRSNTERPETVDIGTNELLGKNPSNLKPAFDKLFSGNWKKGGIPKYWDGLAAKRIVEKLIEL
tara:strand:+ start:792 stop:1877 length:1086 start_codon:yes stop_codon:yes gene_type:complete